MGTGSLGCEVKKVSGIGSSMYKGPVAGKCWLGGIKLTLISKPETELARNQEIKNKA